MAAQRHFFSAGTPLSYSRTSGLWAYACCNTCATCALGHTRFQAAGNGFENAAREIAQMWGEDNVSTEVCGDLWLMAMSKDAIRLQANFTKAV